MHTINLKSEITIRPALTATSVKLLNVADSYARKTVTATVAIGKSIHQVIVWKDAAYDTAGQWTDATLFAALEPAVEAYIARGFKNEGQPGLLRGVNTQQ
jgi:hypothetical protein